jgi:predicted transposase YdaD
MSSSSADRPSFDQALKRLLLSGHDGVLALIAPDLTWRGELSPELPAVARQADLVWEVVDAHGRSGLLHIELQSRPDPEIAERLAEYAIRLWRRYHLPMRSVVVFLRPTQAVPPSPFVVEFAGRQNLFYPFDVARLWEIPAERVLETPHVELWPLAGLMAGATVDRVVATAQQIAAAPVGAQERSDLAGLLVLLAGLRLPTEAVLEALRRDPMINDLVRESGVAGALIDEAKSEGRREGLDEGLSEGQREGLDEGLREAVRLAVEGRLGPLDNAIRAAIERADQTTLRSVLAHIASDEPEQLRARLR